MKRDLDSNVVEKILCAVFSILGIVFMSAAFVLWTFIHGLKSSSLGLIVPAIVFVSLGGIFFITGIIFLIIYKCREQHANRLLSSGQRYRGEVINYKVNYKVSLNRKHPVRLVCDVYDSFRDKHIIYMSGNYWDNVDNLLGKKVDIYVDQNSEKKYHVNLASLYEY